jgi:hypothetical protein
MASPASLLDVLPRDAAPALAKEAESGGGGVEALLAQRKRAEATAEATAEAKTDAGGKAEANAEAESEAESEAEATLAAEAEREEDANAGDDAFDELAPLPSAASFAGAPDLVRGAARARRATNATAEGGRRASRSLTPRRESLRSVQVLAVSDFTAQAADEMDLVEGTIYIGARMDEHGEWWSGHTEDYSDWGHFPCNHVVVADARALARLTPKSSVAAGLDTGGAVATVEKSFLDSMRLFELECVDPSELFDELSARQKEEEEFLGRAAGPAGKRASITFGTFRDGFLSSVGMDSIETMAADSPLRAAQAERALEFIFGQIDADTDGRVSRKELCAGVSSFFTHNPKQTAAAVFAMYDTDGSGVIDFDELGAYLRAMLSTAVHADERCVARPPARRGDGCASATDPRPLPPSALLRSSKRARWTSWRRRWQRRSSTPSCPAVEASRAKCLWNGTLAYRSGDSATGKSRRKAAASFLRD